MNLHQSRKANYEIDPVYLERWSSRSFQDKQVDEPTLFSLFEAARWAPSANNLQPWRFIIARTPESLQTFYRFINEGNLAWCKRAPVLTLVASEKTTAQGKPIRSHAFDAGAAWGYLALEAARKGLVAHAMGGFNKELARDILAIPDEFDLHAVVAIGYRGDANLLTPEQQEREKPSGRRQIHDSIYMDRFGNTLS